MKRHQDNTSLKESEMVAESCRELHAVGHSGDPVERVRLLCLSHGASGFLRLGRLLRRMDKEGSKTLTITSFVEGLKEIGMEITDDEAKDMFAEFDTDGSGSVNIDEFLHAVRKLPESRITIIDKAFQKIDKTGNGTISMNELKKCYNVRSHSMYISGEESEESILKTFLDHFEDGVTEDRMVTKEEFLNYYSAISASVDNDGYFDLIIRQAYKLMKRHQDDTSIKENEMVDESSRELQAVGHSGDPVERVRLLCLSHGTSGFLRLGRLLRRMDKEGNKKLTIKSFVKGLKGIGMDITDDEAKDMFVEFDTDGSGSVNIDEFLHALRNLPEGRMTIIDKAFQKIDKTGNGIISMNELKRCYDVRSHSMYISGEESRESILKTFLDHFEDGVTKDRMVTKEEFLNYYAAVSASVDNDGYFDLIIRQAYTL